MDFLEIKKLSIAAATEILGQAREELRALRFRIRHGEEKQVHRVAEVRRKIAHLLTHLGSSR